MKIEQRHGSADPDPDPDPHQNVMDPQHCYQELLLPTQTHNWTPMNKITKGEMKNHIVLLKLFFK
jgi:hypothetical protein